MIRRSATTITSAGRGAERGAVTLEALVVAIFLVIAFFCVVGIGGLYKAKLLAMQDSRYLAVHNAVNNCEPAGKAYFSQRPPSLFDEAPITPAELPAKFGVDFVRIIQEGGGISRARSTGQFGFGTTPGPRQQGPFPQEAPLFTPIAGQVSSDSFMLCNEKAAGVNLWQVVTTVSEDVKNLFVKDLLPQLAELGGLGF